MMRRLAARRAALLASLTVLSLAASAQQMQTYRLSNANPSTLPSGSGTTSVVLTGTFPTFGSTYAVCFYNGTPTTPIVPDSATATSASITVPSSDFLVPGNASIYLAHATDSCTGTSSGLSNVLTFVVSAQQEYNISSASPGTIGAGSGDTLVTLSGNALVDLSGFQFAVCFYAGTANTPITPSSADQYGATFTVPASTFQIAPSLFSSGQYNASIYVVPTYGTCNGTNPGISNSYTMPIDYPTLASDSLSALPINGVPGSAPTVFEIFGSNFSTTTQAAIAYNSSPASNVAGKAVGNGLVIPTPVVPAGTTSISINACNISGSYSYCSSSPLPIAPYTLASTTTTLAGTDVNAGQPAPLTATVTEGAPTPISTDSGPYLPGPPASTVTITEGTSTLGSGPLQVQNLSFIALGSRQINFLAGTDAVSTGPGSYDRSANSSPKIHALDSSTPITPVLSTPFTSLTADFNKDGLTDALFVQSGFGTMHLFLGTGPAGNLQFEQSLLFAQSCFSLSNVAVADFNGDGYPDIAYLCGDSGGGSEIYVAYNQGDGTFPPYATDIAPANGATLITAADLDRNGTQDIVVAGPNGASEIGYGIQSFLNAAGNGTFTTGPVYGTAFNPGTQIVAKDLNNDGAADLVLLQVKGEATTIQTYQNNGSGTFTPAASFPVETSTSKIFVTTFTDTAAYPDIAVLEPGTGIAVALNGQTGDISFGSPVVTAMASITDAVPGDINADTLTDIVYNNGTDISVLYGLGDGTFAPTSDTTYSTSFVTDGIPVAGTSLVAATDLNNDGFADILAVVANQSQENTYYASTFLTTGNLSTIQIQPTLAAGTHNLVATYKGNIDLLGSTGSGSVTVNAPQVTPTLSVYSNPAQENGSTTAPISPGSPYSFTFTVGQSGGPQPTGTVTVYQGESMVGSTSTFTPGAAGFSQGTISFGSQSVGTQNFSFVYSGDTNYTSTSSNFTWTVTQVTGVSTTLALISGGSAVTTIASGNILTLTATVRSSSTPITPGQVLFCDANGASCSDIHLLGTAQLSSSGTASIKLIPAIGAHAYKAIFLGNKDYAADSSAASALTVTGTYPTTTTIAQSGAAGNYTLTATTVGVGSGTAFSPNGTIPFVDTSNNNTMLGSATLGSANYAFGFSNASNPTGDANNVATGDFNGDGKLDLIVTSATTPSVFALLGNADGTFTAASPSTLPTTQTGPIVVADFNADGKLDLAITTNTNSVVILLGQGDGTFTAGTSPSLPAPATQMVAGDFSGDGIQDLALTVSGDTPQLIVLLGHGDGTFTASSSTTTIPATSMYSSGLAISDFNADGKADLAIASGMSNTGLLVLLGNGDGTFTAAATPTGTAGASSVAVADFNADGKADLAFANMGSQTLGILLGKGDGTFTTGTTPSEGSTPNLVMVGDFNGDGKADLVVTNNSETNPTLLLGNGDGTFAAGASINPASGQSRPLTVGDFNGDGQSDLAVPNLTTVAILLAHSTQTATAAASGINPTGAGTHQVVAEYLGDAYFHGSTSAPTTLTGTTLTPVIHWATPAAIPYGTPLSATQLDAQATDASGNNLTGTYVYSPAAPTILPVGTTTDSVIFTPTGAAAATYGQGIGSAPITVTKANPPITWNPATPILTTTILGPSILDATSTVAGTFVYNPAAGLNPGNPNFLPAGSDVLSTTFTPTDTTDYNTITTTTTVLVTKATPSIVLQVGPGNQSYSPNAQEQLTAFVDGTNLAPTGTLQFFDNGKAISSAITGAFTSPGAANLFYGPFTISPVTAGSHSYTATFSGDSTYLGTTSAPTPVAIGQITPILSWTAPAAIQYGTALSTTQLDAQAKDASGNTIPGLFTYTPALGSIPQAGSQTLSATFVPTDTVSYVTPTTPITTILQVNQAPQTITFAPPASPASAGTSVTLSATGGASGHPVVFSVTSGPANVTGTNGSTLNYTGAGTVIVAANQAGNTNYAAAPTVSRTIVVNAAQPSSYTAPSTPVGTTSATQTAFVNFTTSGTLNSISVLTKGSAGLDFNLVSGGTCAVNTAYTTGETCSILYSFTPLAPGSRLGAIVIKDATGAVLGTSYLQGTGTGPVGIFTPATPSLIIESLQGVRGLSTDGAGNLYALETTTGQIDKFAAGSANQTVLGKLGITNGGATAIDGAGNLYVSAYNQSTIYELAGGAATPVPVVTTVNSPDNNLVVDGAGNLYLTSGATGSIYKVAAETHTVSTLYTGASQRFEGMGIDSAGNLYPADYNGNALLELPAGASTLKTLITGQGLALPSSVALDPAGNIYVVNNSGSNVLRFAAGTLTATTLPAAGNLGIALDGSGNLFTVTSDTNISFYPRTASQTLTFPATPVGTTSNSLQTEEFENDGNTPLVIASYLATPNFTTGSPNTCAAGSFAAGATCTLSAIFQPATAGTLTGAINITDNTLNTVATVQPVPLSGTSGLGTKTITFPAPASPVPAGTSATLTASTSNGDPIVYSITSGTALITGSVTIAANSPATSSYAAAAQVTRTVVVNQVTPTITWNPNPATIPYPTRLSGSQLNATASVPGTFSYSQPLNTLLGVGPHLITATFTPTNLTNYTTAIQTATITVTQSAPILTWATPAPIPYGTMLSNTQLDAQAKDIAGNTVPGVFTYTPALNSTPKAGLQTLSATFIPTDTVDYATPAAPITTTLQVNQITPILTWATPAAIPYGTHLSPTQLDAQAKDAAGNTIPGVFTYNPPLNFVPSAGTQVLSATFIPTDTIDYATPANPITTTLQVNQGSYGISWPTPSPITYGTLLSNTQLDAQAKDASGNVIPGTFKYTPGLGALLPGGINTLSATFTPTDTVNYTVLNANTTLTVTPALPTLAWPSLAPINQGTPLGNTQLDPTAKDINGATLAGVFTYTPPAGTILLAGAQRLMATFVPADTTDYQTETISTPITVLSPLTTTTLTSTANPSQFGQPIVLTAAIVRGGTITTPLTGTVSFYDGETLIGKAIPVVATETGATASQTVSTLATGKHQLSAIYSGDTNYQTSTNQLALTQTVNIAPVTLSWTPTVATIPYGTPLSAAQLDATPISSYVSPVVGLLTYSPTAPAVLTAGSQTITATFTPTDTTDFLPAAGSTLINVTQATPTLTWPAPTSIVQGTVLSATQLNAVVTGISGATLPGTFTYTPAAGTRLQAGTTTLNVLFTPTDSLDYTTVSGSVLLTVTIPNTTVTLTSNLNPSQSAQLVTLTATVAQTGTSTQPLTGTVTFLDSGKMIGAGTLSNGVATLPISTLAVGTHFLTAAYNGSTAYAASTSAPLTQSVGSATITISWTPNPSTIPYGTALALGAELDATASSANTPSVPGTFTYSPAAGAILTAGTQTLSTTFTPTDTVNFAAQTATRALTVTQAKPTITWTPPAAITQGTPLSATQLDAVVKGVDGAILAGTVKYTPAATTILPSGPSTLSVTFTPTDAVDYTTATLTVPITVNIPAATSVLTTTTNPTQYGQPTTLTATVTPGGTLTALPTGTVTFFDNGKNLGMATLSGGIATLPISTLVTGAHSITAAYSGDTANAATTATAITQTVTQATPTITWTPTVNSIVYGTPLSAAQLDATAATPYFTTVPGAFSYPQQTQPILTAGTQTLTTAFTPTDTVNFASVTKTITITVTQAKPTITWPTPTYTVVGTVLSGTQLDATATGVTGATLPGAFVYTPPAGTVVTAGMQSLSVVFTPTDTLDYTTATATVPLNGTPVTLTNLSSTTTTLGAPAQTITLTGTGFVSNSTARSNGGALTTTYVNATTLTAVLPASSFTTVQTLQITVFNPTQQQASSALPFTVTAPPTGGTVTAPTTANPGDQPAVKFTLNQTYPVDVTGTFTITFTPTIPGTTQDPALKFTNGMTTYSFVVPAGQTATPNILLQTGTISGTVTLTLTLEAGGITLPTTIPAATITLPEVVPGAPTVTLVRDGRNLTVNSVGFSNTRSVTTATFHFIPAAGQTLQTTDISIDVTALFAQWYSSAQSQTFGSSFLYSQLFTLDDDASVVGQVTVTLSNALGVSAVGSSQ
jgi:hypothetical protein